MSVFSREVLVLGTEKVVFVLGGFSYPRLGEEHSIGWVSIASMQAECVMMFLYILSPWHHSQRENPYLKLEAP